MKKLKKLMSWILAASMTLGMTFTVFAEPSTTILDVTSEEYKEESGDWVVPKTTADCYGEMGGKQRAAASANPKVRFTLGNKYQGKYKVEFFRVQSTSDTPKANFFVHENGVLAETVELNLQKDRGWTEIGIYNFSGDVNDVVIENGTNTGWLRISAIRLVPVEYLNSLSVISNNDKIGTIPFTASFAPQRTDYTAYAGFLTDSVTVNAEVPEGAKMTISAAASNTTGNTVTLKDGENRINIILEREDNGAVTEYNINIIKQEEEIVDFNMPDRVSAGAGWKQSTAQSAPYGVYGRWCDTDEGDSVTYKPIFDKPGNYEINVYRVIYGNDSADKHVQWEICHSGKTDTVYVDNLTPGISGWEKLGVFDFSGEDGECIKASRADASQNTTRVSAINYKLAADNEFAVSKPSFYEKDGEGNKKPIYKLNGGISDIECSYTMSNTTQTVKEFTLIMAVYDDGVLENIVAVPSGKAEINGIVTQPVSIEGIDTAGKTIKVFLWDSAQQQKPLCGTAEIQN